MKYKVLVSGSNGLIGSHLLRSSKETEYIPINVRETNIKWPDIDRIYHVILIHCAWKSIPGLPSIDCLDLSNGDKEMSKSTFKSFTKKYSSCSIIFISTAGDIYKRNSPVLANESSKIMPSTYYSKAKLEIETVLNAMSINTVSLRISNAWGAKINPSRRNGFIDKAIFSTRYSNIPTMISPSISSALSIIHVDDICIVLNKVCKLLSEKADQNNFSSYSKMFILSSEIVTIRKIINSLKSAINAKFIYNQQQESKYYTMVDSQFIQNELKWNPSVLLNPYRIKQAYDQYDKIERKELR